MYLTGASGTTDIVHQYQVNYHCRIRVIIIDLVSDNRRVHKATTAHPSERARTLLTSAVGAAYRLNVPRSLMLLSSLLLSATCF